MISITSDIDWAPDYVIDDMLDLLDKYSIKATFFCTHKVNIKKHELGIHPNFLPNSTQGKTPSEILFNLKKLFPNAKGARAHNLFNYSSLFSLYKKFGITYDSSILIPSQEIQPYLKSPDILEIPINFEDDLYCLNQKKTFRVKDLKVLNNTNSVFNFHPIHIFLNTNSMNQYKKAKPFLQNKTLKNFINSNRGIRNLFIELLEFITTEELEIVTLKKINNFYRKNNFKDKMYC